MGIRGVVRCIKQHSTRQDITSSAIQRFLRFLESRQKGWGSQQQQQQNASTDSSDLGVVNRNETIMRFHYPHAKAIDASAILTAFHHVNPLESKTSSAKDPLVLPTATILNVLRAHLPLTKIVFDANNNIHQVLNLLELGGNYLYKDVSQACHLIRETIGILSQLCVQVEITRSIPSVRDGNVTTYTTTQEMVNIPLLTNIFCWDGLKDPMKHVTSQNRSLRRSLALGLYHEYYDPNTTMYNLLQEQDHVKRTWAASGLSCDHPPTPQQIAAVNDALRSQLSHMVNSSTNDYERAKSIQPPLAWHYFSAAIQVVGDFPGVVNIVADTEGDMQTMWIARQLHADYVFSRDGDYITFVQPQSGQSAMKKDHHESPLSSSDAPQQKKPFNPILCPDFPSFWDQKSNRESNYESYYNPQPASPLKKHTCTFCDPDLAKINQLLSDTPLVYHFTPLTCAPAQDDSILSARVVSLSYLPHTSYSRQLNVFNNTHQHRHVTAFGIPLLQVQKALFCDFKPCQISSIAFSVGNDFSAQAESLVPNQLKENEQLPFDICAYQDPPFEWTPQVMTRAFEFSPKTYQELHNFDLCCYKKKPNSNLPPSMAAWYLISLIAKSQDAWYQLPTSFHQLLSPLVTPQTRPSIIHALSAQNPQRTGIIQTALATITSHLMHITHSASTRLPSPLHASMVLSTACKAVSIKMSYHQRLADYGALHYSMLFPHVFLARLLGIHIPRIDTTTASSPHDIYHGLAQQRSLVITNYPDSVSDAIVRFMSHQASGGHSLSWNVTQRGPDLDHHDYHDDVHAVHSRDHTSYDVEDDHTTIETTRIVNYNQLLTWFDRHTAFYIPHTSMNDLILTKPGTRTETDEQLILRIERLYAQYQAAHNATWSTIVEYLSLHHHFGPRRLLLTDIAHGPSLFPQAFNIIDYHGASQRLSSMIGMRSWETPHYSYITSVGAAIPHVSYCHAGGDNGALIPDDTNSNGVHLASAITDKSISWPLFTSSIAQYRMHPLMLIRRRARPTFPLTDLVLPTPGCSSSNDYASSDAMVIADSSLVHNLTSALELSLDMPTTSQRTRLYTAQFMHSGVIDMINQQDALDVFSFDSGYSSTGLLGTVMLPTHRKPSHSSNHDVDVDAPSHMAAFYIANQKPIPAFHLDSLDRFEHPWIDAAYKRIHQGLESYRMHLHHGIALPLSDGYADHVVHVDTLYQHIQTYEKNTLDQFVRWPRMSSSNSNTPYILASLTHFVEHSSCGDDFLTQFSVQLKSPIFVPTDIIHRCFFMLSFIIAFKQSGDMAQTAPMVGNLAIGIENTWTPPVSPIGAVLSRLLLDMQMCAILPSVQAPRKQSDRLPASPKGLPTAVLQQSSPATVSLYSHYLQSLQKGHHLETLSVREAPVSFATLLLGTVIWSTLHALIGFVDAPYRSSADIIYKYHHFASRFIQSQTTIPHTTPASLSFSPHLLSKPVLFNSRIPLFLMYGGHLKNQYAIDVKAFPNRWLSVLAIIQHAFNKFVEFNAMESVNISNMITSSRKIQNTSRFGHVQPVIPSSHLPTSEQVFQKDLNTYTHHSSPHTKHHSHLTLATDILLLHLIIYNAILQLRTSNEPLFSDVPQSMFHVDPTATGSATSTTARGSNSSSITPQDDAYPHPSSLPYFSTKYSFDPHTLVTPSYHSTPNATQTIAPWFILGFIEFATQQHFAQQPSQQSNANAFKEHQLRLEFLPQLFALKDAISSSQGHLTGVDSMFGGALLYIPLMDNLGDNQAIGLLANTVYSRQDILLPSPTDTSHPAYKLYQATQSTPKHVSPPAAAGDSGKHRQPHGSYLDTTSLSDVYRGIYKLFHVLRFTLYDNPQSIYQQHVINARDHCISMVTGRSMMSLDAQRAQYRNQLVSAIEYRLKSHNDLSRSLGTIIHQKRQERITIGAKYLPHIDPDIVACLQTRLQFPFLTLYQQECTTPQREHLHGRTRQKDEQTHPSTLSSLLAIYEHVVIPQNPVLIQPAVCRPPPPWMYSSDVLPMPRGSAMVSSRSFQLPFMRALHGLFHFSFTPCTNNAASSHLRWRNLKATQDELLSLLKSTGGGNVDVNEDMISRWTQYYGRVPSLVEAYALINSVDEHTSRSQVIQSICNPSLFRFHSEKYLHEIDRNVGMAVDQRIPFPALLPWLTRGCMGCKTPAIEFTLEQLYYLFLVMQKQHNGRTVSPYSFVRS